MIVVDGAEQVGADWSVTTIPVPPGRHRVEVYVPHIGGRYAPAEASVDVAPGGTVPLEYLLPYHRLADGSLGPPPQRRKGL